MPDPNAPKTIVMGTATMTRVFNPILENFGAPKLGQLKECNAPEIPELPTPVWLVNEGLECTEGTLTFAELHAILVDMTKCAETIAVKLPKLVEEKRKKVDAPKTE